MTSIIQNLSPALLFDELAEDYENMRHEILWSPFPHIEDAIANTDITNWKCLDLGCATGETSRYLASKNAQPIGLDISEKMCLQAAEKSPGLPFIPYDLNDGIPFPDNHFDFIIALGSLEYLPDQKSILREMAQKLKPNGLLLAAFETHGLKTPGGTAKTVRLFEQWTRYRISYKELRQWSKNTFSSFKIKSIPGYFLEETKQRIAYLRLIARK